ncbi:hypothetical protein BDW59DRAFT_138998 [Aspergillus cavernicola]|uniref:Uncharacterized protein n=1 Tax=Aspergillus cavernicola TaxID=176166 RepID=A0ABR4IZ18_9EURO
MLLYHYHLQSEAFFARGRLLHLDGSFRVLCLGGRRGFCGGLFCRRWMGLWWMMWWVLLLVLVLERTLEWGCCFRALNLRLRSLSSRRGPWL